MSVTLNILNLLQGMNQVGAAVRAAWRVISPIDDPKELKRTMNRWEAFVSSRAPVAVIYRMKLAYEQALFEALVAYGQKNLCGFAAQDAYRRQEKLVNFVHKLREEAACAALGETISLEGALLKDYQVRLNGFIQPDAPPSEAVFEETS